MFEDDQSKEPSSQKPRGNFDPLIEFIRMTAARPRELAMLRLSDLCLGEEDGNAFDRCGFVFIGKADRQIAVSREAYQFLIAYVGMDRHRILSKNGTASDDAPDSIFLNSKGRRLSAASISEILSKALHALSSEPGHPTSGSPECRPCKWLPPRFMSEEAVRMYQQVIERLVIDQAKNDHGSQED